jgi:hypothetical protein
MQYRNIEYQVVQTSSATGWKWTVQLDEERSRTGSGFNRTHAIGLAQRAIDKILQQNPRISDAEILHQLSERR